MLERMNSKERETQQAKQFQPVNIKRVEQPPEMESELDAL